MKYVLYGLPCAGKTTLLNGLDIPVIHGSTELNKMAVGKFDELSGEQKTELRKRYAEQLSARTDTFISDGHYSFLDDVVFTKSDGRLYDVFLYLYAKPEIIAVRIKNSPKNERFSKLSVERIRRWQDFEIESLREECHKRNRDFYVVHDISPAELRRFIGKTEIGFSSFSLAQKITDEITAAFPSACELHIADGDRTIILQDSFRICTDNFITHAFDGNFYTGYQSLRFTEEVSGLRYDTDRLSSVQLNDTVYRMIAGRNYVVLSSGIKKLWDKLSGRLDLKNVIADTLISADTKFFVVRLLREKGYKVISYGDSRNDYYMLKQSDEGYLYIGNYLSRSLRNTNTSGLRLLYDKTPYILSDNCDDIANDIRICKSDSGINGSPLASAHIRLGERLGSVMRGVIPDKDSAVIVLERGGRFFGDGVYSGFGGTFYSYDPKKETMPVITKGIAIIIDSVINTGRSVLETAEILREQNPGIEIVIVSNVIQDKALELLKGCKVFAVRTSSNSFVGRRQASQRNGKGPDTADRLFNYIG